MRTISFIMLMILMLFTLALIIERSLRFFGFL